MTDLYPPHDSDDPLGYLNAFEAALLAHDLPPLPCPHCHDTRKPLLPMSGNGWGVETFHEPDCPDHDDNLPAPERPQ